LSAHNRFVQDKKAAGNHFSKNVLPKYNAALDGEKNDAKLEAIIAEMERLAA